MEDQYPVAALWEQLSNVANAKQGNSTNNKWYDWFNTKLEVAKSVGVSFDFNKIWEYCAMEAHKAAYTSLRSDKQEAVRVSARERFLSYALIKRATPSTTRSRTTCWMTTLKGVITIRRPGCRH